MAGLGDRLPRLGLCRGPAAVIGKIIGAAFGVLMLVFLAGMMGWL